MPFRSFVSLFFDSLSSSFSETETRKKRNEKSEVALEKLQVETHKQWHFKRQILANDINLAICFSRWIWRLTEERNKTNKKSQANLVPIFPHLFAWISRQKFISLLIRSLTRELRTRRDGKEHVKFSNKTKNKRENTKSDCIRIWKSFFRNNN